MEKGKKNKILNISAYIILIISVLFVTLSSTYAWFDEEEENVNKIDTEQVATVTHEGIELTSSSIHGTNLVPANIKEVEASLTLSDTNTERCVFDNNTPDNPDDDKTICFLYDFTVKNNGDSYKNVLYKLTPTENTFANLKYKIYHTSLDDLTSSSSVVTQEASLERNNIAPIELTGLKKKINANESLTYTIVFWINKLETDQTIDDAGKSFKATLLTELFTTGYGYMDVDAPIISNVTFSEIKRETYGEGTIGQFTVGWKGEEVQSDISKFVVQLIDTSGTVVYQKEYIPTGDETNNTYSLSGNGITGDGTNGMVARGSYYARVYGEDSTKNSGLAFCSENNSDYCGKSEASSLQYLLIGKATNYASITTSVSDRYYGGSVSFNVSRSCSNGVSSSSWSIKYGNSTTSFNNGNGTGSHTVSNLTNDFTVDGQVTCKSSGGGGGGGSCLAEGTEILLANGQYKNIEDIDYDDLLTVIDHQNGGITYEYPIWIENELVHDEYINVTFSDKTEIKVVVDHGFFSMDDIEFVNVLDETRFHVGTKVAKLNNGKIETVTVEKIETIKEDVKYYYITSSRYLNVIANDLVTGGYEFFVTNFYGFNRDLTWKEPMAKKVYTNEELPFLPYYIYRGMRLYDGIMMDIKYGITREEFSYYLQTDPLSDKLWNKPKLNENGKREWMVTTSDDIVTDKSKSSYLMEEGDYYTLKEPKKKFVNNKKFVGWLFTGENTMHQPGEKVKVIYGTHFIAKYDDLIKANISDLK